LVSQQTRDSPPVAIERYVTDGALRLTAQLSGFAAKDLEVSMGIGGPLFAVYIQIQISGRHQL